MRPTLALHTLSPFLAMLILPENPCAESSLWLSIAYVITRVATFKTHFAVSDSLDDIRMPTVGFFEDFYSCVPYSFFTAGFLDR
jgi:hypothetical protein